MHGHWDDDTWDEEDERARERWTAKLFLVEGAQA